MNRADDEVSGEAGLHGDGGGLRVANFADHDDLRVLAHERAQRDRIGEFLVRIDLRLADHGQVEFHRVLNRADANGGAGTLHEMVERGVNGGGLAGTGRAGQQNQSARPGQEFDEGLQGLLLETQTAKIEAAVAGIEDANNDLLPAHGGEDGDTEFDPAQFGVGWRVAFLRQIGLIRNQVGHHFEATGNFLHQIQRQVDEFVKHSIEPDADHERALPGLDVEVAGADFDGVDQQVIDQRSDFNAPLVGNRLQITCRLVHALSLFLSV